MSIYKRERLMVIKFELNYEYIFLRICELIIYNRLIMNEMNIYKNLIIKNEIIKLIILKK